MLKILIVLSLIFQLTGCVTTQQTLFAKMLNQACLPKSCLQQALIYADYLGGTVYSNSTHAFVVKSGILYDSTNPLYSGYSIYNWRVRKLYGNPESWKELL